MKSLFLPLLLLSICLTSCGGKSSSSENPALEKQHLQHNYKEYMDNNYYKMESTPLEGTTNLLVVPVWFNDSPRVSGINTINRENVRKDIETAYFGSAEETGWNSVKSYYETLSSNKLTYSGIVTPWFECGYNASYFYDEDIGLGRTNQLVNAAVEWYKSSTGTTSMDAFDVDDNGYIDGIILIYAAPDYSVSKLSGGNLWAYTNWLEVDRGTKENPNPNVYFWASYDFMYGKSYKVGNYASGDNSHSHIDTHTFIHEMGHAFGLEDYYDYSNKASPAASFSMQDYNVGSHDPYSVMAFGWADPFIVKEEGTYTIGDFQSTRDFIIFSHKDIDSVFDEYMLLELFTPTGLNEHDCLYSYQNGYPQGPNVPGLRLWHVDARLVKHVGSKWSPTPFTDPHIGKVYHMMSNTYYTASMKDYASPLGKDYGNYNLLQLIRNDKNMNYIPRGSLKSSYLFKEGSTFDMATFKAQFVNGGKMNDNNDLGWTFVVDSVKNNQATITFKKAS